MTTRIIHRLVMGDSPAIPKKAWEEANPGWVVRDWGEESVLLFDELHSVINDLYDAEDGNYDEDFYLRLSPVLGYAIVREFGGVFVGEGNFPFRVPTYADSAWYASPSVFGSSISNDPFWTVLLDELKHAYSFEDITKPGFLDRVSRSMPGFLAKARAFYELVT